MRWKMRNLVCYLTLFMFVCVVEGTCRGKQNYRVEINMQWTSATDSSFKRGMKVGGVLAVTHSEKFKLFERDQQLNKALRVLVEENRLGPAISWLERLSKSATGMVNSVDKVTSAQPRSVIGLNAEVNGDRAANYLSIFGALQGTPDFFFGTAGPINLCDGRNFTKKYPPKSVYWFSGFDAGFDKRTAVVPGGDIIPENKGVHSDPRPVLDNTEKYGYLKLTQGKYDRHFPFWKILVIVGVVATAILVAFICLYPVCCKKQMLDVPVPLQDESQWAT